MAVVTNPGGLKPPPIHQIKAQTTPQNSTFQLSPEVDIKLPIFYTQTTGFHDHEDNGEPECGGVKCTGSTI